MFNFDIFLICVIFGLMLFHCAAQWLFMIEVLDIYQRQIMETNIKCMSFSQRPWSIYFHEILATIVWIGGSKRENEKINRELFENLYESA